MTTTTSTRRPETSTTTKGVSVPPGVEYHQVLAGEKRRIGRGILAIALLVVGLFGTAAVLYEVGAWIDGVVRADDDPGPGFTPVSHAAGMISVALMIPWSMVIQRWLYGVRGASLHSVVSAFRFDLFGRALLVIAPLILVAIAVDELSRPAGAVTWSPGDVIGILVVTVLLVPLQATGEEYGLRGLVFRVAASWGRGPRTALLLGIGASAAVFALMHVAPDPGWNAFYLVFSVVAGYVTWRTGGIEIAAILHSAVNVSLFLFWIGLHADLGERLDRSVGAMTPELFVPLVLVLLGTAVVVGWRTRRTGPALTPAVPDGAERTDR